MKQTALKRLASAAHIIAASWVVYIAVGCNRDENAGPPAEVATPRHVLLISIDTCRADHLGCYGNPRNITPNIDKLASHATVFEHAYTPAPMTLPAHSTMMTGTDPTFHGVRDNMRYRLADSQTTLAEVMQQQGYATGAFVSAFVLDKQFGLAQGFDHYDDAISGERKTVNIVERSAGDTAERAIDWLDAHHKQSFLLFAHFYDPHEDYVPPQPYATTFRDEPYAGEIAYVDHHVGRMIDKLKSLGIYDQTLIIVTSDHGEMLGEHGEPTHSYFVYESAVHVPLIIRAPGQLQGRRVAAPVGLIDILPTVCGFIGAAKPGDVQGLDLSQLARGEPHTFPARRKLYVESLTPTKYGCNGLRGLTDGSLKYILANRQELYDLPDDPWEANNLAADQPQRAAGMLEQLDELVAAHGRDAADAAMVLDDQTRRQLEAIGYAGGAIQAAAGLDLDANRADPKDRIDLHVANGKAVGLYYANDLDACRDILAPLLDKYPDYLDGHILLADVDRTQGRYDDAIARLNTALAIDPHSPHARMRMGMSLTSAGRPDEAVAHYEDVIEHQPEFAEMHMVYRNLGDALRAAGKPAEAVDAYMRSLERRADVADVHNNLGLALREAGEMDRAIEHLRKAVALQSDDFAAQYNLADALAARGDLDGAIEHFRLAASLSPRDVNAQYRLGETMMRARHDAQAVEALTRVTELAPNWPVAYNAMAWILATRMEATEDTTAQAVTYARRACELTSNRNASFLDTLAAAYASAGQYDQAAATAEQAVTLARAAGAEQQAKDIASRGALYRQGKPHRDQPAPDQ